MTIGMQNKINQVCHHYKKIENMKILPNIN